MSLNVNKILLSSLLTGILMLPYWGSFYHLFEGHNHKTCEISETHLHEIDLDCDVLDYHFATSIEISHAAEYILASTSQQKKYTFFYLGYSFSIDAIDTLRGPPTI